MSMVKTAISIDKQLFRKVDRLARQLTLPRSQVFVLAVRDFLRRRENQELFARINNAYADQQESQESQVDHMLPLHREVVGDEW